MVSTSSRISNQPLYSDNKPLLGTVLYANDNFWAATASIQLVDRPKRKRELLQFDNCLLSCKFVDVSNKMKITNVRTAL